MKSLVIHSGMAKTGSSSIQHYLGNEVEALRQQEIFYPGWSPFNHSFELSALFRSDSRRGFYYRQFAPESENAWEAELNRLRERWLAFFESEKQGTFVLSAESLEHFSPAELRALMAFVTPHFEDVRVILYVRHPLEAIKSRWQQAVKQLSEPAHPDELLIDSKKQAGFGVLRRWSKVVSPDQLIVRPFDSSCFRGGTLLMDFFTTLGLPTGILPGEEGAASNPSFGVNGTAFLLRHNARLPVYKNGATNPERGLAQSQELFYRLLRNVSDQPLALNVQFSEEEADTLNGEIGLANQYLSPEEQFAPVVASNELTQLPDPGQVSLDFLSDLVNELALALDQSSEDREHLRKALASLEEENANLLARLLRPARRDS